MAKQFFEIKGLDGAIKALTALPPEVVSKGGGPVRVALQRAAKVLQKETKGNVQKIMDDPSINIHDLRVPTGRLRDSIVARRGRPTRKQRGEAYNIRISKKQYPDRKSGTLTVQIGRLLEYGAPDNNMPPRFWMRKAFDTKKMDAVNTFVSQFWATMAKVRRKLGL